MKHALILALNALFFYSVFWKLNIINAVLIGTGLGLSIILYKIPEKNILSLKYPLIVIHLAITAMFFIFPHLEYRDYINAPVVFIAFYSILFYLASLKENEKSLYKEVLAISILFLSSFFNLLMVEKPALIVPIGIFVVLFLFIIGHNKVPFFIIGYLLIIITVLTVKKNPVLCAGFPFSSDIQRYLLILTPLFLFIWSFIRFVKNTDMLCVISFLVFLYIMLDIFITVGVRFSGSILYQPLTAIMMISPALGIMMKQKKR